MLYFENASFGKEGFNTHVMSWIMAASISNFVDCDFFFEFEIPSSIPPDFAGRPEFKGKFDCLLTSKRSLVSDIVQTPNRRVFEIDRTSSNKLELKLLYDYFLTTEEIKSRLDGGFLWNSFALGRIGLTREFLRSHELIEWTGTKLSSPALFFLLPVRVKTELMRSVRLLYRSDIEKLASRIVGQVGNFYAIHLRMSDFLTGYVDDGYSVNGRAFRNCLNVLFADRSKPVLVTTDALQDKEMFASLFSDHHLIFIDELIFDDHRNSFEGLDYTDFNVLTVLNQLICAAAEIFVGTYRSTFTAIIHRLRQERYERHDFHFVPDGKIAPLLNEKMELVPDRAGFFDWNRFSELSKTSEQLSWMREWDHQRTTFEL